jgi:hypothetical protein
MGSLTVPSITLIGIFLLQYRSTAAAKYQGASEEWIYFELSEQTAAVKSCFIIKIKAFLVFHICIQNKSGIFDHAAFAIQ